LVGTSSARPIDLVLNKNGKGSRMLLLIPLFQLYFHGYTCSRFDSKTFCRPTFSILVIL